MQYILGVDFGSQQDYTAMALVRRVQVISASQNVAGMITEENLRDELHLMYLERIELGTSYYKVVERIKSIMRDEYVSGDIVAVPDATGVGIPVVQMMRREGVSPIVAISIHGGNATSRNQDMGGYNVPKRDLVTALTLVVQSRRLKVASDIKHRAHLVHEMASFTMKSTSSGADTYEALMEKDHDDLVMALAMAVWYAEKHKPAMESEPPLQSNDLMA